MIEPPEHERSLDDYRTLADAIPLIVWSAHADGSVEYLNEAWFAYTGQRPAAGLRTGWIDVMHPDDLARTLERWGHAVATLEPYDIEYRLRRHDGAYRWFADRARVVRSEGSPPKWYGSCTDIDEFKNAEAAIRADGSRFRRLANSLPQIVWTTNAAGINTYLNNRWFDYTGLDPRKPHDLAAVTHPDEYPKIIARWKKSIAEGAIFETEYRIRRADGPYRWFLVRAVPMRDAHDSISEWFGTCTDIDDQKRTESQIRDAYEREHRIATTLQRTYLTHDMPKVAGLRFDAHYRPAEREAEVGGDWYDAIELDDGRIVISIGDVAGHGLDAAVVMGNVRQSIRIVSHLIDADPAAMLDAVDRTLRRQSPDTIVTAFVGIIDPRTGDFSYASAGHPPPLLYANETISELWARGLPLGLREGRPSVVNHMMLPADGVLVLYTDGLIESTRDVAEGERRLREALVAHDRSRAENAAEYIQRRVLIEGANDDVAVLVVTIADAARRASKQQVA